MVTTISKIMYKCPYCDQKYETEYEARTCAEDCHLADIEEVTQEEITKQNICEYCNEEWHTHQEAEECEQEHIETQDKHYEQYQEHEARHKLLEAGHHPSQRKIYTYETN